MCVLFVNTFSFKRETLGVVTPGYLFKQPLLMNGEISRIQICIFRQNLIPDYHEDLEKNKRQLVDEFKTEIVFNLKNKLKTISPKT
jgi:hypothetical protein